MREIKFRGKKRDGDFVYGDLRHRVNVVGLRHRVNAVGIWCRKNGQFGLYEVDPESVAQLIGYDKDGNEVYEGDALIDEEGMPINSLYVGIIDSDSNAIDGEIGNQFDDVWLKKE